MIATYRYIGRIRMQSDGFHSMPSAEQKKYIIRQYVVEGSSFNYKDKGSDEIRYGRIVMMDLDTKRKSIRFSSGAQIDDEACARYLIFKNYAPNDPNIYATHTGYKSIFSFDLLGYIQKNKGKIQWSEPDKVDCCINFLKKIRSDFFTEDQAGIKPKHHLLSEDQVQGFPDPETKESLRNNEDPKIYGAARKKATQEYFQKQLTEITGERQAYALTIDGKFIHEVPEVASCYLDALYYHILEKQFPPSGRKGLCHICSRSGDLAKEVFLKQKFYGVTYPYFFDGASSRRSSSAFSMCRDCYKEVTVGIQYAETRLKTYFLGLNCLVLPELDVVQGGDEQLIDPNNLQAIIKLLRYKGRKEHTDNLDLVKRLQQRLLSFSLFFYFEPSPTSQEFIVNRFIKGISLDSLVAKTESLDRLCTGYDLESLFNYDYGLSFEKLRFLILPSHDSHPQIKPGDYQRLNRDLLSLLSAYLYSRSFDHALMIRRFVDIYSRKNNHIRKGSTFEMDLSPFIMNLYLKHLYEIKQLRGIKHIKEKPMTTYLEDTRIMKYFENNAEVYQNNRHAQGLFILGWYVSEIEKKQRKKGIERTAVSKLNLRGTPLQKVKSTMAIMDEMRKVWDVYNDPVTDAYYRECLSDIEKGSLSPEDVVFHILSGRAYNNYLSIMDYRKHKQESQEAENDQQ